VWLDAGVRLIQLRAKHLSSGAMLDLAAAIVDRGRAAGATIIVNDRADVARMAGAAGVHVGQDDLSPADARRVVGPTSLVGLSTHSSAQVDAALAEPISYLAIGPVYATSSKGGATDPPVGVAGVRDAVTRAAGAGLPVVAIGGITLDRAPDVIAAGASSVAVISDLLTGDIAGRARAYLDLR
jgi:thiamine-phosphate pyrophosphorylase